MAHSEYWSAANTTEQSTTSATVWSTGATLTFTPSASKDYVVFWSGVATLGTFNSDSQYRLYESSSSTQRVLQQSAYSDTGDKIAIGGMYFFTSSGSPSAMTFQIQCKSATAGVTTKQNNTRLVVLDITSLDAKAEALTRTTAITNTLIDKISYDLTVPAGGGDYLIIATFNADSTAYYSRFSLLVNAVESFTWSAGGFPVQAYCELVSNIVGTSMAVVRTLAAGTRTIKVRFSNGDSGGTTGIAEARLLCLRLSEFTNAYTNQDLTGDETAASGSTTYRNIAAVTQSTAATDFLLIASGNIGYKNGTGLAALGRVRLDATDLAAYTKKWLSSITFTAWCASVATLSAASHTFDMQYATASGTVANPVTGAIALLELPQPVVGGTPKMMGNPGMMSA